MIAPYRLGMPVQFDGEDSLRAVLTEHAAYGGCLRSEIALLLDYYLNDDGEGDFAGRLHTKRPGRLPLVAEGGFEDYACSI